MIDEAVESSTNIPATGIVFLARLVEQKPERRRAPGIAGYFAHKFSIGTLALPFVIYEPGDFKRAQSLLHACGYGSTLHAADEAAPQSFADDLLVAARPLHLNHVLDLDSVIVCAAPTDLLRVPIDAMLVCETFDSLLSLERMPWVESRLRGRRTLAVFRGSVSGTFRRCAVDGLLERTQCPTLGLVSFGPQGLALAAQLPRLEAVCYPEMSLLERFAQREATRAFRQQAQVFGSSLLLCDSEVIAQAWKLMKQVGDTIALERFPAL